MVGYMQAQERHETSMQNAPGFAGVALAFAGAFLPVVGAAWTGDGAAAPSVHSKQRQFVPCTHKNTDGWVGRTQQQVDY